MAGTDARATDDVDIATFFDARDAFQHLDFATAARLLGPLVVPGTTFDPRLLTLARSLYAASLYAQNDMVRARTAVQDTLRADPEATVDSGQFDAGFVTFFNTERVALRATLNTLRVQQEQARTEQEALRRRRRELALSLMATTTRIEHTPRGLMFLPFGVGQFANRQPGLGVFFLASEAVFLAASITTYLVVDQLRPSTGVIVNSSTSTAPSDLYFNIQRWEIFNYVAVGLLAATAVTGVVQALVAYVPDVTLTVPRAVPAEIRNVEISAGPQGAALRLAF